jgi:hypothetical protein
MIPSQAPEQRTLSMPALGGSPFPPRACDEFDAWLRAPVPLASPDPGIEIRRAQPSEFERIYDLIDEAFEVKRSRALCDWAYRRNPYGLARCWISEERATGRLVGVVVNWPWPLAHGTRPLPAAQGGDAVTAPGWQRRGIHEHAGTIRESHPWIRSIVNYGWPNPASVRRVRKRGRGQRLVGALSQRILPLHTHACLAEYPLLRPLSAVGGPILDTLFATWSRTILDKPFVGCVERVQRFDNAFDEVTRRCMPWEGYWSPHDAEFLNWRYLGDPVREHVAFALTVGTTLAGYAVVRIGRGQARLMELVVPDDQPQAARTLVFHVLKAAADAGCSHVAVAAPPPWPHWRLLRSAGFVRVPSSYFMYAYSFRNDTPDVQALKSWRFLGGDLDPFID